MIDTVFINGTVGAGKTTTAEALIESQAAKNVPNALIDLDQLRRKWPSPIDDPFNHELELKNLKAVARNYRSSGATRFVIAGVIEHREEITRYIDAVRSKGLLICRIRADPAVLEARLRFRHAGDQIALRWHLARVGELDAILERESLDDIVLDSSAEAPSRLVRRIEAEAQW